MEPTELHAELAAAFRKKLDVCTALLSVLEEERHLMADLDPEKLYGCLKRKEVLALKLGLLVDTVRQLRGRIAESVELPASDLPFGELLHHLDEPHRTSVRTSGEQLWHLVSVMGDLTRRTDRVVSHALVNVERSVGFLRQLLTPGAAYTPSGTVEEHGLRGGRVQRRA